MTTPEIQPHVPGLLIVVSGPSGGGKTTLCHQIMASDQTISRAVTCTTRAPRAGERNGVDYFFLDEKQFQERLQSGDLLEHATVHGRSYGTLKSEVIDKLRAGKDLLLNVDVQGAAALKGKAALDPILRAALITVFLAPRSMPTLEGRLRSRGTESDSILRQRLAGAHHELARWKEYDYLIISDTVGQDAQRMESIVRAERMRTRRLHAPFETS